MRISTVLLKLCGVDPDNARCAECGGKAKTMRVTSHRGAGRSHNSEFKFGILNIEMNVIYVFCTKRCRDAFREKKLL